MEQSSRNVLTNGNSGAVRITEVTEEKGKSALDHQNIQQLDTPISITCRLEDQNVMTRVSNSGNPMLLNTPSRNEGSIMSKQAKGTSASPRKNSIVLKSVKVTNEGQVINVKVSSRKPEAA